MKRSISAKALRMSTGSTGTSAITVATSRPDERTTPPPDGGKERQCGNDGAGNATYQDGLFPRRPRSIGRYCRLVQNLERRSVASLIHLCHLVTLSHEREDGLSDLPVSYTHLRAHETPEHLVC